MSGAGIVRDGIIRFLPGVALLMMQCRYVNPLCFSLALLACLWASVIYVKILPENQVRRVGLFVVIFAGLYYVAGGAVVLYAVLAGLNETWNRRGMIAGMIFLIAGVFIVWFWGANISDMFWANAFPDESLLKDYGFLARVKWQLVASLPLLPLAPKMEMVSRIIAQGLYVFIAMAAMAGYLWKWLRQRRKATDKGGKREHTKRCRIGRAKGYWQRRFLLYCWLSGDMGH